MVYLYVPGLEASNSASDLPFDILTELFVTWRGKPIASKSLFTVCKKVGLTKLLSGMTLRPFLTKIGMDEWILSLPASPASLSVARDSERPRTMKDGSGRALRRSLAIYDRNGYFLRMSEGYYQQTLDGPLEKFSGDWPVSGTMSNGTVSELRMSEHPTEENESSSWRTPGAELDHHDRGSMEYSQERVRKGYKVSIADQAKSWPTPKVQNACSPVEHGQGGRDLQTEVSMWPTPTAQDERKASPATSYQSLKMKSRRWGTPRTTDWKDGDADWDIPDKSRLGLQVLRTGIGGQKSSKDGQNSPQHWPTPRTGKSDKLESHHDSATPTNCRLNPLFVEWLMGLPLEWTALEPLETPSFQRWLRSHS